MYHQESIKMHNLLKEKLPTLTGGTKFKIGDIEVDIKGKDGIGGLIEEWFGKWAASKGFTIRNPKDGENSQTFPDYYIGDDHKYLEIKSFDSNASANFDIANFESYCESLSKNPERLNADYLIFGYEMHETKLHIKHVWLKKIWEICCASKQYPLKTQVKRGVIYNIRPASWYSKNQIYKPFPDSESFIKALYDTQKAYKKCQVSENEMTYHKNKIIKKS